MYVKCLYNLNILDIGQCVFDRVEAIYFKFQQCTDPTHAQKMDLDGVWTFLNPHLFYLDFRFYFSYSRIVSH